MPELADLRPGEVAGFEVAGTTLLACRIDGQVFAYRDHCPVCDDTLAGAGLQGALLRCPRCGSQFDVVHAGAGAERGSPRSRAAADPRRRAVGGTAGQNAAEPMGAPA